MFDGQPRQEIRDECSGQARGAYAVIARGPDGQPRCEPFDDRVAYRTRLVSLERSDNSLSYEEIARLLDT